RAARLPSSGELRTFLAGQLPDYMLPARYLELEELPLSANGKLDRAALPQSGDDASASDQPYLAPEGPLQELVAETWSSLLQRSQIGAHDDFFALGGHSLLATQVVAHLNHDLGDQLSVQDLFEAPTVAGLVARLEQLTSDIPALHQLASTILELQRLPLEELER